MVITLQDILPMQKGTAAFTEYSFDERVVEYMMENEESENWKIGHIHSHNTMNVFFSGTDWSELEDNAPNHNVYTSLIVNNFMDFCAKVCFIAETEPSDLIAKDENGQKYTYKSKDDDIQRKLVVYDCEIDAPRNEIQVDDAFKGKVAGIIKAAEPKHVIHTHHGGGGTRTIYEGFGKSRIVPVDTRSHVKTSPAGKGWSKDFQDTVDEWDDTPDFFGDTPHHQIAAKKTNNKVNVNVDSDNFEEIIEEFTMFVVNTGNDVSSYKDLEDVLEMYRQYGVNGKSLARGVLEKYTMVYEKFFDKWASKEEPTFFRQVTEDVLENLNTEIEVTRTPWVVQMLRPVSESLHNMLEKFNKHEFSTGK